MRNLKSLVFVALLANLALGCDEIHEGFNSDNDIIVRNTAEGDLWIQVNDIRRGRVENNGLAETVWDDIYDGRHELEAFKDSDYSVFHCRVETDYLSDGEDFYWYLEDDDRFSGTFNRRC